MNPTRIESVTIRGFRSLADFTISGIPNAAVLIGANGSGKSNFIRFFEMMSWMLRSRNLAEFIERQGGADDQLFRGNRTTPRMDAEISLRTYEGRNDYLFALSYAHPDRFFFSEERFRFSRAYRSKEAPWQSLEGGHREAAIVDARYGASNVNSTTASVIVHLLRDCSTFQFHDTSDGSNSRRGGTWKITTSFVATAGIWRPYCTGWSKRPRSATRLSANTSAGCSRCSTGLR